MMEDLDETINYLLKNEVFLHVKVRWYRFDSSITYKFVQEKIDRYTPSEEHRKKCKDDLCHINAKLEFVDYYGSVINCKFKEEEKHRK